MLTIYQNSKVHFIDERKVAMVTYDKADRKVIIYAPEGGYNTLSGVDSVIYNNDAQPASYRFKSGKNGTD